MKKIIHPCLFFFGLLISSITYSHESTIGVGCRQALVDNGHFNTPGDTYHDPFVARSINEMGRFQAGHTDAPHMTAEQVAKHATYRIVPRNQTPINEAEVVFVVIHGNGGGNSGPHSLSGVLTEVQKTGIVNQGEASKFYVEAPALPGAEAGPNRENYTHPDQVVEWTINYLVDLRKEMKPGAKLVVITRSSGADFGIKAAIKALEGDLDPAIAAKLGDNEGLVTEVIAMSPTTTGVNPEDKHRLIDAEKGAMDDLSTNGSGVNKSAFSWIMSMLHKSIAWTKNIFRPGPKKPKYKFLSGSQDKQVPISEREFDSRLAQDSEGNLLAYDFLGAHHDTFSDADGYSAHDQAWPIIKNYIRQEYLGIPASDANISAESFQSAPQKNLGTKVQIEADIPITPKTLEAGYEAGFNYRADDVYVVENAEAAKKHYESSPHAKTAVYVIAGKDLIGQFKRASGIPGFSHYRKGARIPNFPEHAKNGRLRLKTKDGVEILPADTFVANELLRPQELMQYATEGRLVERQFKRGQVYYLRIHPSNIDTFRTWTKLKGDEQKSYGLKMSQQDRPANLPVDDSAPQSKEGQLVNFAKSCPRGDILVLPSGWHIDSATNEQVSVNAKSLDPQRFDPVYFERFEELVDAAEKKHLYLENAKGNIEYVSPDAIREWVAEQVAKKINAEGLVKKIIGAEQKAENETRAPTGNAIVIENGVSRPLNATELASHMNRPESSTLTFSQDGLSPATLRYHAWSKPTLLPTVKAEKVLNSPKYQQAIENNTLGVQKDNAFWSVMMTAKNEISNDGLPVYDVHSWLLPQVLYHQKLAHSIEVKDGAGNVIAGAILLNRGDRWSIDALVDVTKLGDPLKLGGLAKRKVASCDGNPALEKAFAEALKFAFESGAKQVEVDRVLGQVQSSFENLISEVDNP